MAIDTSSGTSAAVMDQEVLSCVVFDDPFGHAENVGTAISSALSDAGIKATDVTAVVIGRGPAPYTGLRVGMAAGLAFAKSRSIPAYGVMVLDAYAFERSEPKLLLVSDAKRRELFVAGYENGSRSFGPEVKTEDSLSEFGDFLIERAGVDAAMVARFAKHQLENDVDLSDLSAIYLRSPDVQPSPGKKVSG